MKYVLKPGPDEEGHELNNYLINSVQVIVIPMTLQPELSQTMIYAAEMTAVITAQYSLLFYFVMLMGPEHLEGKKKL